MLAISLALLVALVLFFESRDDSAVDAGAAGVVGMAIRAPALRWGGGRS